MAADPSRQALPFFEKADVIFGHVHQALDPVDGTERNQGRCQRAERNAGAAALKTLQDADGDPHRRGEIDLAKPPLASGSPDVLAEYAKGKADAGFHVRFHKNPYIIS